MGKRMWGKSIVGVLALLVVSSSALVAQRPRPRPAAAPAANDLKITYRTTTGGQSMENTTMLKGARERSEMKMGYGMEMINITQCDLRQTVQISDKTKKYIITPMETVDATVKSAAPAASRVPSEPSRIGGVITYNITTVDTGERQDMFGFKARHIKTTISIESSPDACSPMKQKMETDGWYIDFAYGLNCETSPTQVAGPTGPGGGCRDRVRFNRQGAARPGYPLKETTTMYGPNGEVSFTSTKEVIELSREPLDAALFDVPAGYAQTTNQQELYGMPSMDAMMAEANQDRQPSATSQSSSMSSVSSAKAPGVIRVGVVRVNNRTDRGVSAEALRGRLVSEIEGNGIEAIGLNAITPGEAEAEAKAKQCDFILYTDLVALKVSAAKKLGGMFGRAAGVGGIDKTEAKVEYKLFAVGETRARLQSAASAKEEGDEASAQTAISQEARAVSAEVRKRRN